MTGLSVYLIFQLACILLLPITCNVKDKKKRAGTIAPSTSQFALAQKVQERKKENELKQEVTKKDDETKEEKKENENEKDKNKEEGENREIIKKEEENGEKLSKKKEDEQKKDISGKEKETNKQETSENKKKEEQLIEKSLEGNKNIADKKEIVNIESDDNNKEENNDKVEKQKDEKEKSSRLNINQKDDKKQVSNKTEKIEKKAENNSLDDKKERSKKKDNDEMDANKKDGQNENTTDVKNAVKLLPTADPLQKSTIKMIEEDGNKINTGDGVQKDNGKEESKEKTDCKNDIEDRKENISVKKKNVDTNKDAENKKEETEGKKGKTEQKNEPELNGKIADEKKVKFSASKLEWDGTPGAQQVLKLTNSTGVRQALKIKSSDNDLYRVNPVFANFDAGETLEIVITRLAGRRKPDKLVVCTASNENGTDARQTFLRKDILISTTIVPQLTS